MARDALSGDLGGEQKQGIVMALCVVQFHAKAICPKQSAMRRDFAPCPVIGEALRLKNQ
jgi:hypothetical protein